MKNLIIVLFLLLGHVAYTQSGVAHIYLRDIEKDEYWSIKCLSRYNSEPKYEIMSEDEQGVMLALLDASLDSLYLVEVGNTQRILGIAPGDMVTVTRGIDKLNFDGGNRLINEYLEKWTSLMIDAIPGMKFNFYLPSDIVKETFPLRFVQELKNTFTVDKLLNSLNLPERCLEQLGNSNIKDSRFLMKQEERVIHVCAFLYSCVLKIVEMNVGFELPIPPQKLIDRINIDDRSLINFWQLSALLNNYFDGRRSWVKLDYDFDYYLQREAELIPMDDVREFYVLDQLNKVMLCGHWERLDKISHACKASVTSEFGREKFQRICRQITDSLSAHPFIGKQVMDFSFENKEGTMVHLKDFRGKYVLIDIWATWCGPCKKQFPFVRALEEEFGKQGVEFVSISTDVLKDKETWRTMVVENGLGTALFASNGYDTPFVRYYQIEYIPHFLLVAPDGVMLSAKARKPSDPLLRMYIRQLLNNK